MMYKLYQKNTDIFRIAKEAKARHDMSRVFAYFCIFEQNVLVPIIIC